MTWGQLFGTSGNFDEATMWATWFAGLASAIAAIATIATAIVALWIAGKGRRDQLLDEARRAIKEEARRRSDATAWILAIEAFLKGIAEAVAIPDLIQPVDAREKIERQADSYSTLYPNSWGALNLVRAPNAVRQAVHHLDLFDPTVASPVLNLFLAMEALEFASSAFAGGVGAEREVDTRTRLKAATIDVLQKVHDAAIALRESSRQSRAELQARPPRDSSPSA